MAELESGAHVRRQLVEERVEQRQVFLRGGRQLKSSAPSLSPSVPAT
jgi:hypothetical protein